METHARVRLPRNAFLDTVQASGLLAPDDLIDVLAPYDPAQVEAADPIQLATYLVRRKKLTKFQAMQLLSGRTVGFILGPYRILDGLRQDRVGMVFRAERTDTKRPVWVKVLPTDRIADDTVYNPFVAEVKAAAKVAHPNIARVLDMRVSNGTHFVVTEDVPAATLDKVLAEGGRLDPTAAARTVAQVAVGLMAAHARGILHRDVKPGNIAILPNGSVKLIDLGLTHMLENPWQQVTRRIKMKEYAEEVAHLAPEQAWGSELDARSDVYSLGSTFYALLTGRPPFPGHAVLSMAERQTRDIPAPSEVRSEIPREIDELVQRMGSKDPQARPQSAADVVRALHAYLPVAQWEALKLEIGPATPAPTRRKVTVAAPPKRGLIGRVMAAFGRRAG